MYVCLNPFLLAQLSALSAFSTGLIPGRSHRGRINDEVWINDKG